jgi:site-specific recombinase XerD
MGKTKKAEVKQNPQLKERVLAGGKTALYLEYYLGRQQEPRLDENGEPMYYQSGKMAGKPMYRVTHTRKQEDLKLYLVTKPRTTEERAKNNETKQLAEAIRQEREQARLNDVMGYRLNTHKEDNLMAFFDTYLADYTKRDKRNIALSINRFKTFLRGYRPMCATKKTAKEIAEIKEEWAKSHKGINGHHAINENEYYRFTLKPGQLDKAMVEAYKDYLMANSEGEGAATAFARFKKVVKYAHDKGILKTNPCADIARPKIDDVLTKDILTAEEITKMINTHYPGESGEIRHAFIFSLFTGIRWCDVKELRYQNVDYTTGKLEFDQLKTKGHSRHSRVTMPLRADLLEMIGTPEANGKTAEDCIFNLPSHTMCLKALRHWTARAGIDKHITWHCARHSFATQILQNGATLKVTADLLGHANFNYLPRYTRAIDEAKAAAVNSLPTINL